MTKAEQIPIWTKQLKEKGVKKFLDIVWRNETALIGKINICEQKIKKISDENGITSSKQVVNTLSAKISALETDNDLLKEENEDLKIKNQLISESIYKYLAIVKDESHFFSIALTNIHNGMKFSYEPTHVKLDSLAITKIKP